MCSKGHPDPAVGRLVVIAIGARSARKDCACLGARPPRSATAPAVGKKLRFLDALTAAAKENEVLLSAALPAHGKADTFVGIRSPERRRGPRVRCLWTGGACHLLDDRLLRMQFGSGAGSSIALRPRDLEPLAADGAGSSGARRARASAGRADGREPEAACRCSPPAPNRPHGFTVGNKGSRRSASRRSPPSGPPRQTRISWSSATALFAENSKSSQPVRGSRRTGKSPDNVEDHEEVQQLIAESAVALATHATLGRSTSPTTRPRQDQDLLPPPASPVNRDRRAVVGAMARGAGCGCNRRISTRGDVFAGVS